MMAIFDRVEARADSKMKLYVFFEKTFLASAHVVADRVGGACGSRKGWTCLPEDKTGCIDCFFCNFADICVSIFMVRS